MGLLVEFNMVEEVEVAVIQKDVQQGLRVPSMDDFWAVVQRLKANFNIGLFKGLEQTLSDVLFWISSWSIWNVYNVREWLQYLLGLVLATVRISGSLQTKVENLKIGVKLGKLADFIQGQRDRLGKVPDQVDQATPPADEAQGAKKTE